MVTCLLSALGLLWWPTGRGQLGPTSRRSTRRQFRLPAPAPRRLLVGAGAGAALLLSMLGGLLVGVSAALVGGTIAAMVRSELTRRRYQRDLAEILAATRTLAREVQSGAAPAAAILAGAAAFAGTPARVLRALAVAVAGHRGGSEVKPVSAWDFPGSASGEPVAGGPPAVASADRDVAAEVVSRLACGWSLSARYGVPWAALIETVSVDLAYRVRAAAQRDAQVSGPRVSGYVLAVLPALGILLGWAWAPIRYMCCWEPEPGT